MAKALIICAAGMSSSLMAKKKAVRFVCVSGLRSIL